mmetsp:Transcript_7704/g.21019  ORF Transcript_7704/g.21019 Transcript_7704/m.21019 type:complete len:217 (+) Transcript_7704:265-915(+)
MLVSNNFLGRWNAADTLCKTECSHRFVSRLRVWRDTNDNFGLNTTTQSARHETRKPRIPARHVRRSAPQRVNHLAEALERFVDTLCLAQNAPLGSAALDTLQPRKIDEHHIARTNMQGNYDVGPGTFRVHLCLCNLSPIETGPDSREERHHSGASHLLTAGHLHTIATIPNFKRRGGMSWTVSWRQHQVQQVIVVHLDHRELDLAMIHKLSSSTDY